jgi:uncharacterized membrane protein/uncharacterized protein YegL
MGPVPDRLLAAFSAVGDVEAYSVDRDADPDLLSTYDLVVITEESSVVPQTSTLWLRTVPQGVRDGDPSTMPMLDVRSAPHVLVADVDASAMSIWRVQPLELLAGAEPLLTSDLGVLAWARTTSVGRQVVFGFGLDDSDWTSQVGFPTFVAALIEWVAPRVTRTHAVCVVGRTCALPLEAASATSRLLDPEGSPVAYATRLRQVVGDPLASAVWDPGSFDVEFVPDRSGAYSIEEGDVHVSLPVMAVPVGAQPSSVEGGVAGGSPQAAPRPLRRWLIGGAVAVVLAEVGLTMFGLRPVVRRRKRTPLVLVGLTVVAASLALLNVPVPLPTQGASLTLVGPTSSEASLRDVGARSPGWPWRWVRQWSLTEPASSGSGATQPYEPAATGADELSLAIEMALAGHADAQDRRVAVVTDAPSLTTEEVRRLAARALRLGLEVDVVRGAGSGEPGPIPEVRIERLATPHRVHAYSPFVVSTNVVAAADHGWTVRAELVSFAADAMVTPEGDADQGAPRLPDPTGLSEESGTGTETIDLEFVAGAKGDLVYRLTVTAADGTQLTDPATVVIAVGDSPSVLLVSMDDVQGLTLQAALEAQGVTVSRSTPFRMPSSAEALGVYDAVILVNVPASEMFPEYQAMLEHFVREGGGGLLVFGGVRAFGPGGYYSTPLEELSPLSSLVTDDAPEVAMAFVLDRSGSMSGAAGDTSRMELAKQATLEAISLLGDESTAAIIVFDTVAHEVVPFTSVLERNVFERALDGVTPAGGTSIYPALEAVYGLMAASDAATRHIVVMTDGLSQDGDFARAIGALNDLGVSTSFVGVGSGADRRQLSNLAGLSGGALHMARDFRSLPGLLAQEALMLSADPIEERLTRVVWAGGTTPDFLSAIADSDMPALSGYVRTTAKPEAALHLYEAVEEEPILATWRYGLGRVAAFASEADGAWSQAWVGSPSYGRLWSQLVRWSAESPVRGDWSLRFAGRGGVLDVLVDVPSGTGPADELPSAELWLGELRLSTKRLTPVGDELAAVSFDVGDEWTGLLEVRIQPDEAGDPSVLVDETVAWPLAAGETVRSDLVPLEALAEATGGSSQLVTDYRLDRVGRTLTWAQQPELWLLLALASFLLALASRYGVLASPARRVSRSAAT